MLFSSSLPIFLLMTGPSKRGRLKEAKIVRQSRRVKSAKEGSGTGLGGPPDPKSCTNARSFARQSPTLEAEEAANLVVPLVM
jgi:hypothetical protein